MTPEEIPNIDEELSQVFSLYQDGKIVESIRLLEKLKQKHDRDFFEYSIVQEIESDYKDIRNIYEYLQDRQGWVLDSKGKISVSYKNIPGTPTYSLLTEAEIDVPLFNFITLLYETDLYTT